ncbi:uncharacterized protein KY384_006800 [Bacidia gigantensis]|uniref:uncharacterized protein n=1 Tax=Bacidia gigantensis TaxID=2732470 RepID=UPI001D0422B9|nr:uncharacterized protein KY384_006800 [Bacidia gigantensis]KAG8527884.1 hypothetical protein KY384_006800 [Bacidia gigantensis]
MHELLLLTQAPSPRHDQLLNILAGISGMQPVPILEKHLLFKPNRSGGPTPGAQNTQVGAGAKGLKQLNAAASGDAFYLRVVGERAGGAGGAGGMMNGPGNADEGEGEEKSVGAAKWTIQFRDVPEVVRQRPVTARLMADIPITSGDPVGFMEAMDYSMGLANGEVDSFVTAYYITGHRFTHQNTSILLYRATIPAATSDRNGLLDIRKEGDGSRLLDSSGAYVVQAMLRVQDGSKVEIMNRGMTELLGLKETLKGVVELDVGDRLAMDTRVR